MVDELEKVESGVRVETELPKPMEWWTLSASKELAQLMNAYTRVKAKKRDI